MDMSDIERRALKRNVAVTKVGDAGFEPIAAPIPVACRVSGLSRSEIYRRLSAGDIQAIKSGARTLILMDSLRNHLARLPAATFRAPRAA